MAHFLLSVAQTIGSGGAWVIGSKIFGHGLDKSSKHWQKMTSKPQDWQQVNLNIGGVIFPTSRKTVLSSPKLMQLLHNKKYNKDNDTMHIPKDQYWHEIRDNEFFIDRDPTHFRYILNYIRNNKHCVLPTDANIRKELSIEANFYELHSLVTLLNYNKDFDDVYNSNHMDESVHIPSNLITKDESRLLTEWIAQNDNDNDLHSIDLLFRASEYDFEAKMFHDLCDQTNKPTIVIIQAENGHIFGAYTHCNFGNQKQSKYIHQNGFIFLLRSYGNNQNKATKWKLTHGQNEIDYSSSAKERGPCFVDCIKICDRANLTEENEAYILSNEQQIFLSEDVNFRVAEYEVFQVSKLNDLKKKKAYF